MNKTLLIGAGCTKSLHRLSLCNSGLGDIRLQSLVSFNTLGFSTICNFMQNAAERKLIERNLGEKVLYFNLLEGISLHIHRG
jgi:hypothetical protein